MSDTTSGKPDDKDDAAEQGTEPSLQEHHNDETDEDTASGGSAD